jgi:hypothetical protein
MEYGVQLWHIRRPYPKRLRKIAPLLFCCKSQPVKSEICLNFLELQDLCFERQYLAR